MPRPDDLIPGTCDVFGHYLPTEDDYCPCCHRLSCEPGCVLADPPDDAEPLEMDSEEI